jgi:phosphatidylglycerol---prolipoprotein diacylglyceryl transferase
MHRIIFQFGPLTFYSYGVFVALGIALSILLISRESERSGIKSAAIIDIMLGAIAGGLAGGRLLFVAINWEHYAGGNFWGVFDLAEGGLAIQGALAGGILGAAVLSRVKKISFWRVSDLIAPYMALAQSIGRIGCFLNGCCYGREVSGPFGVTFPGEEAMRVPTQLYSSLGLLIIFVILSMLRTKKRFDGHVFCAYLMIYSAFRFFMDFLRGDGLSMVGVFTLSQVISLAAFTVGALLYFILKNGRQAAVKGRL